MNSTKGHIKEWVTILILFMSFLPHSQGQDETNYSVYLLGNLEESENNISTRIIQAILADADQEKHSAIIFLGNRENGLENTTTEVLAKSSEKNDNTLLDLLRNYKGKLLFIPGEHEWGYTDLSGLEKFHEKERMLETYFKGKDVVKPDLGCPGPETVKLAKDIVLVILDSQIWLQANGKKQDIPIYCENRNPYDVIQDLIEVLDDNDDKIILLAFHHPVFSEGKFGGFYPLADHMFPLRNWSEDLWIPLPVIGSIYPFIRSAIGTPQDMVHARYQYFRSKIIQALFEFQNVIVVSGHEQNLQYFYEYGNNFVISGAGSTTDAVPKIKKALFNSSENGYVKLDVMKNGSALLKFHTLSDGSTEVAFEREVIPKKLKAPPKPQPYLLDKSSVTQAISEEYATGWFHQFLFGKYYRKEWAASANFRTINLSTQNGGLQPVKIGGGKQTVSLRLEDKNEKQFVLRSVQKDMTNAVHPYFRNSVLVDIAQDLVACLHPYSSLMIPPLAKAAGVYHTDPEIVFLPDQPALGDFGPIFRDELYLFEERPEGDYSNHERFGRSQKIVSYSNMMENIRRSAKHHIHQDQVLKSRLFDIYIGDWDRHEDQWRWASFKEIHNHEGHEEEVTFYEPIPRDRDMAFYRFRGFLPFISKIVNHEARIFQTYKKDIRMLKYMGFSCRHFDRSFMNELDRPYWLKTAQDMAGRITDEDIELAVQQLPPEIKEIRKDYFKEALLSRRENLVDYAGKYYDFLSEYVDVVGTEKSEIFEAKVNEDNSVDVSVYRLNKRSHIEDIIYARTFFGNETKEIRLFGLGGNDQFNISGGQGQGPIMRIIGGEGDDVIDDQSQKRSPRKKLWVYDSKKGNEFSLGPNARDKRSDDFRVNLFDREEYYFGALQGMIQMGFNPDEGFKIVLSPTLWTYGFRKNPFKTRHTLDIGIAFGTEEFEFSYEMEMTDVWGKTDFNLETNFSLPSDVDNFFGLSNELSFLIRDFDNFDFFRYKQTEIYINPSFQWNARSRMHNLKAGPYYRYYHLLDNEGKFIGDPELSGLTDADYESKHITGIEMQYEFKKQNDPAYPTSGLLIDFSPSYNLEVGNADNQFFKLAGSVVLYNYVWMPRPFILVSKIQGGVNWGDFNFFQANYLGHSTGLRAFRRNRIGGKSSLVFSNDLRVKLFTHDRYPLPFSFGIFGSLDHGRVWNDGEVIDKWHTGYGGGFWFNFMELMPVSFTYLKSNEGESNFLLRFGFSI